MCAKLLQSCLTLCKPVDYTLPGSSVHGILLARLLVSLPCLPPKDLPDAEIEPVSLCLLHWSMNTLPLPK